MAHGVDGSIQNERPMLALVVRLGAIAGLATMSALIKLAAERDIHIVEIMFWRQFVTLPVLLGWVMATTGIGALATSRPGTHFLRGLYGTVGMTLNFGAVILLPLAEATTFNFTAPIWATILAMLLLKEKVGVWRWSAILAGFIGILLIAQPGGGHIPLAGALVALGGAFMIGLISIQIADLNRTDKPIVIVFYFGLFSTLALAPLLPFVRGSHSQSDWLLLLGIGLSGTVGQLLLTAALRFGKVSSVLAMDYSSLFWAALYGWLLFDMLPPASTWLGAPIIIGAGLVIAWREHRLSRPTLRDVARVEGT
jgi:drug/metabolite transporter (DMT)-like permease